MATQNSGNVKTTAPQPVVKQALEMAQGEFTRYPFDVLRGLPRDKKPDPANEK